MESISAVFESKPFLSDTANLARIRFRRARHRFGFTTPQFSQMTGGNGRIGG